LRVKTLVGQDPLTTSHAPPPGQLPGTEKLGVFVSLKCWLLLQDSHILFKCIGIKAKATLSGFDPTPTQRQQSPTSNRGLADKPTVWEQKHREK